MIQRPTYEQEKAKNIAKIKLDDPKNIAHERISPRTKPSHQYRSPQWKKKKKRKNMGENKDRKKKRKSEGLAGHCPQRNVTNMPLTTASRRVARPVPLVVRMPADVEL